jgi:predicted house-cleaning noncanonical NTP pyrophosphatase (MazG superfamily)
MNLYLCCVANNHPELKDEIKDKLKDEIKGRLKDEAVAELRDELRYEIVAEIEAQRHLNPVSANQAQ